LIVAMTELLSALERDAQDEIRAIRDASAAEVARLDAEAARARAERRRRDHDAIAAELQPAADRRRDQAARAARGRVLAARAAFLARVRDATRAALPAALAARADVLGPRLVADALDAAGDAPAGTLRCAPSVERAARAAAPPRVRVVVDAAVTGVVIELERGVRVDATLDAIVERTWPDLAAEAIR
jgi:vacuolar-type H+-ATPase subunit E/Vma4